MRTTAKILSMVALAAIVLIPVLFLTQTITQSQMKTAALLATIGWFVTAPLWIGRAEEF